MAAKIRKFSRLRFGTLLNVDGFEFWEVLDLPSIPEQPDDLTHRIGQNDRIDLLAAQFYKDARLWWVIAVANGMEILPTDFDLGQVIRIPSPRFVRQVLFKRARVRDRTG